MTTISRRLAVGAVLAGAAVGFAGVASADPPSGSYTGTMIDGAGVKKNGSTAPVTLTACGPDCTQIHMGSGSPHDLHLQGNAYTGSWTESGTACSGALDSGSLVYTYQCGDKTIVIGLTKNG